MSQPASVIASSCALPQSPALHAQGEPKPTESMPDVDKMHQLSTALREYYLAGNESALVPFNPIRVREAPFAPRYCPFFSRDDRWGCYIVLDDSLLIPTRDNFDGDTITLEHLKRRCNIQLFFSLEGMNFSCSSIFEIIPSHVQNCGEYYKQTQLGRIVGGN